MARVKRMLKVITKAETLDKISTRVGPEAVEMETRYPKGYIRKPQRESEHDACFVSQADFKGKEEVER